MLLSDSIWELICVSWGDSSLFLDCQAGLGGRLSIIHHEVRVRIPAGDRYFFFASTQLVNTMHRAKSAIMIKGC